MKELIYLVFGAGALYILYMLYAQNQASAKTTAAAQQTAQSNVIPVIGMSLIPNFVSGLSKLFSGVTTPNTNTSQVASWVNAPGTIDASADNSYGGYDDYSPLVGNDTYVPPANLPALTLGTLQLSDASTGDTLPANGDNVGSYSNPSDSLFGGDDTVYSSAPSYGSMGLVSDD